ncbi:hypothetical protein BDV95DRAFT_259392 [Massariosphaeria phaeospora]|uniref:Uncharacterized protein n=1 Tax=Massariosphaeria phaeospora TaxID=100035 RepID=A0A7C8I5Y7_9PLEO|nr:hypothetical protein BDV95DRAFT_259392 [Massariosphaeria phaeospora]
MRSMAPHPQIGAPVQSVVVELQNITSSEQAHENGMGNPAHTGPLVSHRNSPTAAIVDDRPIGSPAPMEQAGHRNQTQSNDTQMDRAELEDALARHEVTFPSTAHIRPENNKQTQTDISEEGNGHPKTAPNVISHRSKMKSKDPSLAGNELTEKQSPTATSVPTGILLEKAQGIDQRNTEQGPKQEPQISRAAPDQSDATDKPLSAELSAESERHARVGRSPGYTVRSAQNVYPGAHLPRNPPQPAIRLQKAQTWSHNFAGPSTAMEGNRDGTDWQDWTRNRSKAAETASGQPSSSRNGANSMAEQETKNDRPITDHGYDQNDSVPQHAHPTPTISTANEVVATPNTQVNEETPPPKPARTKRRNRGPPKPIDDKTMREVAKKRLYVRAWLFSHYQYDCCKSQSTQIS